jgi:hypothetical protein
VSILAKVTDKMFSSTQRTLAENDPWFVPCSFNLISVFRQKLLLSEILLHSVHEPSPELKTKLSDRVKIFTLLSDMFHTTPDGVSQGRNNTMYVRMEAQVLPPGMQYTDGSALNPVMTVTKRA